MSWDGATAAWWRDEVAKDPGYGLDVDPLFDELIGSGVTSEWLDLGCGDGRLLPRTGALGIDASADLVRVAGRRGRAVVGDITALPFGDAAFAGAYAVLVFEHLAALEGVFTEVARVVRPGGNLVVVLNHPIYTAPGSGPFLDPDDGEVLWRWGSYLSTGSTAEPAGPTEIVFHHRPMAALLTTAAECGWSLERMVERALSGRGDPLLEAQRQVPRLVGLRWDRLAGK